MKRHMKIVLLVLWCLLIYRFSAQPAGDSAITSNFVIDFMYSIYSGIFKGRLEINTFTEMVVHPLRKMAHFSEYMILGIIAYKHIADYRKDRAVIFSLLFSCMYAVSDEVHQYFVPGRACRISDMFIDSCGAIFGILLIHLMSKKWKKD